MDRYATIKQLGRGNFGVVSVVRRVSDGEQFVMKAIDLSKLDESVKKAALNEAQLLSSLNHPCIVGFIESFLTAAPVPSDDMSEAHPPSSSSSEDTLVIIMEYCSSGDVGEVIRKMKSHAGSSSSPPFPEDQILDWFIQVALALKYIHSHHILHRDLKAANCFLTANGRLKLGDFGISKVLNSEADFARTVLGTPYYLSPELCEGKQYGKKSDVWALGLLLYELCTLKHAFDGATLPALVMKILKGTYSPIPASYSPSLHALISMMLSLNPAKRPNITQILRLEFVKQRMEKLGKKWPDIKECWATSMKLNTRKELFLQNLLPSIPSPSSASSTPTASSSSSTPSSSMAPAASPPAKRKPVTHASSSHKPLPSSSKRMSATPATSSQRGGARKPIIHSQSALPPRPKTPPPASSEPPPPLPDEIDLDDDEDDDDDEDEEEEGEEEDTASAGGAHAGGSLASPPRVGIITAGWFDRAAEEYDLLMKNLNEANSSGGGSGGGSGGNNEDENLPPLPPVPSILDHPSPSSAHSVPHLDDGLGPAIAIPAGQNPVTPRKKITPSAAQASSSNRASVGSKASAPSTAAPASRYRSASNPSANAVPNRRRSDGNASIVSLPSAKAVPIQPRASPKSNLSSSPPLNNSFGTAAAAAAAAGSDESDTDTLMSPLQRMMAEIEDQKRRAREWKLERARRKEAKKAQERETAARHREKMKAIKQRSSLAPNFASRATDSSPDQPSGGDASVASAGDTDEYNNLEHPGQPIRALSDPNHHLAVNEKKGALLSKSPNHQLRSPVAASKLAARRKTANPSPLSSHSPSPRGKSPAATPPPKDNAAPVSTPSKPPAVRPSVRDFISAKKKEMAEMNAAQEGAGSAAASAVGANVGVEVILSRARADQPAPIDMNDEKNSSIKSNPGGAVAPATSSASPASAIKKSSKREINFELVLQSPSHHPQQPSQPSPEPLNVVAGHALPSAAAVAASTALPMPPSASPSPVSGHDFTVQYAPNSSGASASPSPLPRLTRATSGGPTTAAMTVGIHPYMPSSGVSPSAFSAVPNSNNNNVPASATPAAGSGSPPPPAARAAQLSYQITQARSLCCSMLGEATFEKCYSYLRANKEAKKAFDRGETKQTPTSEQELERTVKGWFKGPEQASAYSHIQSLIFCEDLINKI